MTSLPRTVLFRGSVWAISLPFVCAEAVMRFMASSSVSEIAILPLIQATDGSDEKTSRCRLRTLIIGDV